LKASLINSTIDSYEKQIILNDISRNDSNIKFLYIAPERLNNDDFLRVISRVNIALVAIDEAHCISQWGHDFRPSYMKIKGFLASLQTSPQSLPSPHPQPPLLLGGEGSKSPLNVEKKLVSGGEIRPKSP
jgi:ATP-dependent DNA helicase RecQ